MDARHHRSNAHNGNLHNKTATRMKTAEWRKKVAQDRECKIFFRHSVALLPPCCVRSLLSPAKVLQPFWGKCFQHHHFQGQHHSVNMFCLFCFFFFNWPAKQFRKNFFRKKRESRWINSFTSPVMWPWPYASTGSPFCPGYVISRMRTVISPWQYISHIIVWDLLGRINMA